MGRGRGGFGRGRGLQSYDDNSHYGGGRNYQSQWSHPQQSGGDDGSDYSVKLTGGEEDKGAKGAPQAAGYGQYVSVKRFKKVKLDPLQKITNNYFRIITTIVIITVPVTKPNITNSTMRQQAQIRTQLQHPNRHPPLQRTIKIELAAVALRLKNALAHGLDQEIGADLVLDPDLATDAVVVDEKLDRDPVRDRVTGIASEESYRCTLD